MNILVIGSLNADYVANVDHRPQGGETITAESFCVNCGGKGANQAYAAARLGAQVKMLGMTGKDEAGELFKKRLCEAGADVSSIKQLENTPTGMAMITVDKTGENSIVVVRGANGMVDSDYVDSRIEDIKSADILLTQLEIPLETVVYAVKAAKKLGKTIVLDPAPARKDIPHEVFRFIDYIKPNETELEILTGERDCEKGAKKLIEMGVKNVIVSRGAKDCYFLSHSGESFYTRIPKVSVIDTTAAGDSFTGAFAAAKAEGKTDREAVLYAVKVSTVVVTKAGAFDSIPTQKEVDDFFENLQPK